MATVLITHDVDDMQRWLSSPGRAQFFGSLGYTVRTFIDPANAHSAAVVVEGPGLDPLLQAVQTPEGAAALKDDGIRPETIRTYVES
jgi:hypothetical protein